MRSALLGAAALALALAGCASPPDLARDPTRPGPAAPAPEMRAFRGAPPPLPMPSNAEFAQDFMDLTFRMESGAPLPRFTRYEGPIRVGVAGPAAPTLERDLDALLGRLRREAGLDIARARGPEANVVIETVPRAAMRRLVPQAACFVVPNAASWDAYRRLRRSDAADWTLLARRDRTAIFVPDGIPPQELRDCLHEELAQAVGPLGDLWHLPGSVFNDDNFHAVLTSTDMALLRATYAPELASGMSEAEVAAALPGVLARLNPSGGAARPVAARTAPRAYAEAIDAALTESRPEAQRRRAAARAVALAEGHGPRGGGLRALRAGAADARLGPGRRGAGLRARCGDLRRRPAHRGPRRACRAPARRPGAARRRPRGRPGDRPRAPAGRAAGPERGAPLDAADDRGRGARRRSGRERRARAARLDALGWARYGFGSQDAVRERLEEIASLPAEPSPEAAGELGS